jgi:hypothetical protein
MTSAVSNNVMKIKLFGLSPLCAAFRLLFQSERRRFFRAGVSFQPHENRFTGWVIDTVCCDHYSCFRNKPKGRIVSKYYMDYFFCKFVPMRLKAHSCSENVMPFIPLSVLCNGYWSRSNSHENLRRTTRRMLSHSRQQWPQSVVKTSGLWLIISVGCIDAKIDRRRYMRARNWILLRDRERPPKNRMSLLCSKNWNDRGLSLARERATVIGKIANASRNIKPIVSRW